MSAEAKPPFRADHVGSLLRPKSLLEMRARRRRGEIGAEQLREAARYVPIERLALNPQCGFSSTVEGNEVTEDDQTAKLSLVVETAAEIWG